MKTWNEAKQNVHDASGIEFPSRWLWEETNGVYYPAKEIKTISMSEDDFYEKYNPIKNHFYSNPEDCSFDGCMFETYGEEVKFVENLANTPEANRSVWTIIEAEGNLYFLSGYHYVNRFGYLITSELVEEGIEIEVELDNEMD